MCLFDVAISVWAACWTAMLHVTGKRSGEEVNSEGGEDGITCREHARDGGEAGAAVCRVRTVYCDHSCWCFTYWGQGTSHSDIAFTEWIELFMCALCVCVCVHTCVCVCAYVCVCVCVCVRAWVFVSEPLGLHACVCVCCFVFICVWELMWLFACGVRVWGCVCRREGGGLSVWEFHFVSLGLLLLTVMWCGGMDG